MRNITLKSSEEEIRISKVTVEELFESLKARDIMFGGEWNLATNVLQIYLSVLDVLYIPITSLFFQYHIDHCMKALISGISEKELLEQDYSEREVQNAKIRLTILDEADKPCDTVDFLSSSLVIQENIASATETIRKGDLPDCDMQTLIVAQKRFNTETKLRRHAFCVA